MDKSEKRTCWRATQFLPTNMQICDVLVAVAVVMLNSPPRRQLGGGCTIRSLICLAFKEWTKTFRSILEETFAYRNCV